MGFFDRFKKPGTKPVEECVLILLDKVDLDEQYVLEESLARTLEEKKVGEFDGNEIGEKEATLYMYGPNSENIFLAIQPVLEASSLRNHACAVVRKGGPGSPQREVRFNQQGGTQ